MVHFLGGAPSFSQRGLAPIAGAALLASFAWLVLRGAHRRSPALVALLAFLLASAGMNALVRVQQGVAAPLLQDRYRFYACAFLAATWLVWGSELAGSRRARGFLAGGLCASLAFSLASHALYRDDLLDFSRRIEAGYERWWVNGDGGLFYPRFAAASRILLTGFERGVLRAPPAWFAEHGAVPHEAALPEPGSAVRFGIGALHLGADGLLVDGWAAGGGRRRVRASRLPGLALPRSARCWCRPAPCRTSRAAPRRSCAGGRRRAFAASSGAPTCPPANTASGCWSNAPTAPGSPSTTRGSRFPMAPDEAGLARACEAITRQGSLMASLAASPPRRYGPRGRVAGGEA